jgi:MFS transporter, ACS family, hexuronate transporter
MKGRMRWLVITMIAVATVINYIDRNALAVMWPEVSKDIGATKEDYALLVTIFMVFYALGQSAFGRIIDRIGVRAGFAVSIIAWSASIAAHALVRSMPLLGVLRATLGFSEAGNWPGAAKANALWFPSRERSFAQGIFNSGASIGGIVSAPLIALLFIQFGWRGTFVLIGFLGVIWLLPWLWLYKADPDKHPWLTPEEREYILDGRRGLDEANPQAMPLGKLLSYRQSWGVILSRFFLDPVWWLFVSLLPIYLAETFGFDIKQIGYFAWVPFVGAMIGSLSGGWLAGRIITAGGSVDRARKVTIGLGCAIMLPALLLTTMASDPLTAVLLIACILFGFQFAIGNIQTLPSDYFGGGAVGSLAGISGTAAVAGTLITTWLVPSLTVVSYAPIFILSAAIVPLAFLSFWLVGGRVEPVADSTNELQPTGDKN